MSTRAALLKVVICSSHGGPDDVSRNGDNLAHPASMPTRQNFRRKRRPRRPRPREVAMKTLHKRCAGLDVQAPPVCSALELLLQLIEKAPVGSLRDDPARARLDDARLP